MNTLWKILIIVAVVFVVLLFACALAGANGRYPEEENLLNEKRTATPIIGCAARLLFF